ncbi:hypothetical protein [Candidatus Magnetobacterium casense]|uniref:hypothetical protein n=1 Tax=Candidatus Magnetobacterium casense TaxID=1455061 RepID=UPI00058B600C|nr:hypothetical protein [Candidatus Magnetobacterium casensis]
MNSTKRNVALMSTTKEDKMKATKKVMYVRSFLTVVFLMVFVLLPVVSMAEEGSLTLPELSYSVDGNNLVVIADNIPLDTITSITVNSFAITDILSVMVKEGSAKLEETEQDTSTLVSVDIYNLQTKLMLAYPNIDIINQEFVFGIMLTKGVTISVPISIPNELSHMAFRASSDKTFGLPTTVAENKKCGYRSTECAKPGYQHTADVLGFDCKKSCNPLTLNDYSKLIVSTF